MEAPFFIVGSARSGTTLLRLMLNAHAEIAVPPESRFITELWDGNDVIDIAPFLRKLAAHPRFQAWDLPVEVLTEEFRGRDRVPYSEAIDSAFTAYARLHGKRRWGDKTPRYVEQIDFLVKLWPSAKFIHLIRDGRNVALSYADVPFGPKTVGRAAQLWAQRVSAGLDQGRRLGPGRYLEVLYEDLVDDVAGQSKTICEFLDVPFDPGMLDYTERTRDAVLPRASRYNPHVIERPRPDVRSWEKDMPARHVEIFEAVAGDVLSEVGYQRRHESPSLGARLLGALSERGLPVGRLQATRR